MTDNNNPKDIRWAALPNEIAQRMDEGRQAMAASRFEEAEGIFLSVLHKTPHPAVRNNLAVIRLEHHLDPQGALDLLKEQLACSDPQPFTRALASRCCVALGDDSRARREALAAEADLDASLRVMSQLSMVSEGWKEYTIAVLRAFGELGDDRHVWELYQRWTTHHNHPHAHYLGGVAAFNRERWSSAAAAWSRIQDKNWIGVVGAYKDILPLLEEGQIPPIRLPYEVPTIELLESGEDSGLLRLGRLIDDPGPMEETDRAWAEQMVGDPRQWVLILTWIFVPGATPIPDSIRRRFLQGLVRFGGDRGRELAERVFESSRLEIEDKIAAGEGLIQAGAVSSGQVFRMIVNGQPRDVQLFAAAVSFDDPDSQARYDQAISLRDSGSITEALEILTDLSDFEKGRTHLPSVMARANILRSQGLYEKARTLFELVETVAPSHPAVLFNRAALALQVEDVDQARALLRELAEVESAGLEEKVAQLNDELEWVDNFRRVMKGFSKERMNALASRPVSRDLPLRRAIALLPFRWLNASCDFHGLQVEIPRRPERERLLRTHLSERFNEAIRLALDADPKGDLPYFLGHLLAHGGWMRLNDATARYGPGGGETVGRYSPRAYSTLGHARLSLALFLGTTMINGRQTAIVGLPAELREACQPYGLAEPRGGRRPKSR